MLLQDFSGGLNTRLAPSLIAPNESQVFTNIDASSGSIRPLKDNTLYTTGINKYFTYYYAKSQFYSKTTESSFVEYRDILYMTNLEGNPTKYDGVNEYRLGIAKPTVKPVLSHVAPEDMVTYPEGDYTYTYTYYNSIDGTESAPGPISDLVTGSDGPINILFDAPSPDPQVDKIRLYRLGGAVTQYSLLVELPNAPVDCTDTTLDIDLAGSTTLETITYDSAPTGLKYLVESYAMLFGAVGDKLYYSTIALPNVWPATNFLDFDDVITGIGAIQNGLLVFTKFKTFIITGNSPETFSKYLLDSSQGCISHYTIQFVKGTLLWLSEDGICSSSGGLIEVVTKDKLGKIALTGIQNAQVHDGVYYLLHSTGMLVLDFRYNSMIRKVVCNASWIGTYFDKLFLQYTDNLYEACSSETPLEYHYKSGVLTEGQYTNYKIFKDFYIKYNGDINLKLYIDGRKMNDINLTGNKCYNLKAVNHASGYGLEIEIQGTGEVSEIQYTALGRQNGK